MAELMGHKRQLLRLGLMLDCMAMLWLQDKVGKPAPEERNQARINCALLLGRR
jgi:hypothetical protein